MKLAKFKKIILLLVFWPSIFLIYYSFFINFNTKKYWYSSNFSNKIDIREPFAKQLSNSAKIDDFDNQFELKLLLNPNFLSTESREISNFNLEFIKKIEKSGLKFKEAKSSEILPIVWFYFDTEKDREFFVKNSIENSFISRYIVYKNEGDKKIKPLSWYRYYDELDSYNYYLPKTPIDKFKEWMSKNIKIVNFEEQAKKDKLTYKSSQTKVGAIEVKNEFNYNFMSYFNDNNFHINDLGSIKKWNEVENGKDEPYHSTLVSLILGSKLGIDTKSTSYLSIYTNHSQWQKAIEWMVVTNNVRVINHSYGSTKKEFLDYNEDSFFLDFLARKYGVINVFAAGNGAREIYTPKHEDHPWIDDESLSLNSIVVGALDDNSEPWKIAKNKIADYSNYKTGEQYNELAKPLVVAPGRIYNPVTNNFKDGLDSGTSYAAPIVTGLISTLLREKPNLDNDDNRLIALKAILSASAISPDHSDLTKKRSGYFEKYGSGTPDFKNMLKASENTYFIRDQKKSNHEIIFTSKPFWVNSNDRIKASLSWMFNAGLLKNKVSAPNKSSYVSWWWFLTPFTSIGLPVVGTAAILDAKSKMNQHKNDFDKWSETHINSERLKLKATKENQKGDFVSDYDLYLQKLDSNNNWVDVSWSTSSKSNDELINFKAEKSGYYRLYVKKFKSVTFDNSVEDKLALSYLVNNEN
ncbi:S8 family serine peptidase [Mesomycoplasma ovipneumoniae]|uniref:S8 family serine peptidase n=3 Tax=Mesomycoplasma ovipneumoniae TaxID=29562 RepID=A0AAP5Y485_9BACT|nr:S8 family serine peptidase [Mesomycoplasma ovipneumoniae]MDW2916155.1 S8 family serine peptidase [Mesomycoplasma ovipneumoniae]MDW2929943.1 S8 family serine peptidase [Mesomycoplasma ovipneumoniae]